jgi:hypothetical protein
VVTVIWAALVARAVGWGWRRICAAGPAHFEVSAAQMVAACSGGWLLGSRPPAIAAVSINISSRL